MNQGIRFVTVLFLFALFGLSVSRADYNPQTIRENLNTIQIIEKYKRKVTCEEKSYQHNSAKFVTTYNAAGQPCKIYDLSFPTIVSLLKKAPVTLVPVQKLSSQDYKDWFHGDFERVYNKLGSFDANGQLAVANVTENDIKNSWFSRLRFKAGKQNPAISLKSLDSGSAQLLSFKLSELNVGRNFRFSEQAQKILLKAVAPLYGNEGGLSTMSTEEGEMAWMIKQPEKLLEKVSFNWNEVRKVFEVVTEFDFLPINGPMDLIDYNIQHKYLVEKQIRSLLLQAFSQLVMMIPEPTTQRIVGLALNESFGFIDNMYEYHRRQLEDTLRMNLNGTIKTKITAADVEKGLNLTFTGNIDLLSEFLNAKLTGQKFDLSALDKKGAATRYGVEKGRNIIRPRLYNDVAVKKGCDMSVLHGDFGVCTKNGKVEAVYSLMSEHTIYMWTLGGPQVYSAEHPSLVTMKRLASYLMAMVLQAVPLPVPGFITGEAINILKGFAYAGMADEAYLLNYLTEMRRTNGMEMDAMQTDLTKWLFAQNINPFLVKREKTEDRLIGVNLTRINERISKN